MKKLTALALCLCLSLCLLTGCGGTKVEYYEEPAAEVQTPAATTNESPAEPTAAATAAASTIGQGGTGFETYPADTVVATIDGSEATWMEYYYWLNYYVRYVQQVAQEYSVSLTSWDANELSSSQTNAEVVLTNAKRRLIDDHTMSNHAQQFGVVLSDADREELTSAFESDADNIIGNQDGVASEEEIANFELYLEQQHVDRAFFEYINGLSLLGNEMFASLYGESGAGLSDEEVAIYAEDNNLMAAKHILLLTKDLETMTDLSEEEIAEKRALAEELLAQLEAVADDQEALTALFDKLMAEYTEDTGYEHYPNGYVFTEGQMVEEFENAVKALNADYELSGIVESPYGFHIVMRIPIDPDAVTGTSSSGKDVTLRYTAAYDRYNSQILSWREGAEIEWADGFETPDLAAIFG